MRLVLAALGLAAVLAGCSGQAETDPLAERGRQVYLGQCMVCHGPDPAQNGPVGPAVKGSSPALVEAKVLRGEYPPGYTPRRPSQVMPPMPALAPDIPALAAYLD
jgi:mono/diheme cytochrome c family protein